MVVPLRSRLSRYSRVRPEGALHRLRSVLKATESSDVGHRIYARTESTSATVVRSVTRSNSSGKLENVNFREECQASARRTAAT